MDIENESEANICINTAPRCQVRKHCCQIKCENVNMYEEYIEMNVDDKMTVK